MTKGFQKKQTNAVGEHCLLKNNAPNISLDQVPESHVVI